METQETKFESLSPNLIVDDVNKTLEYYIGQLGFTLAAVKPATGIYEWGMVKKEGVTIMFQTYNSLKGELPKIKQPSGAWGTLFIQLTGVDRYYDQIKDNVRVVSALKVAPYGMKEFTIQDVNGCYLTFAEAVK